MSVIFNRLTPQAIARVFRSALENGWIREDDTLMIFYDLSFLEKRIRTLQSLFPPNTLHGLAIKACPLIRLLEFTRDLGTGVEAATSAEVHLALKTGYLPQQIVYDSPVKTIKDCEFALAAGIHLNIDNLSELSRVRGLLKRMNPTGTIGIRINPQVGTGTIAESSVAGEYSKFGVPIKHYRKELMEAFLENDRLTGVHLHVGSQGCSMEMLVDGVGRLYDFMLEVNEQTLKQKGFAQVSVFDIGGGLPVSYSSATEPVSIGTYIEALNKRAPLLFPHQGSSALIPQGGIRLITEFGRWVYVNSGWTISRVEYVKHDPSVNTAMIHAGADLFLRECLNPNDWHHEYSVLDKQGRIKEIKEIPLNKMSDANVVPVNNLYNLAGPLCFAGDILAKNVDLPPVEEGDYIVIHDTGGYTFSMWSRYNSRQTPRILGYLDNGQQFQILKERESLGDIYNFWK